MWRKSLKLFSLLVQPSVTLPYLCGLFGVDHVDEGQVAASVNEGVFADLVRHGLQSLGFAVVQKGAELAQVAAGQARRFVDDNARDNLPMLYLFRCC